jgi:hypothetical protein
VLLDELLDGVEVHDDHLEVIVRGAPILNVTLDEVGLSRQTGEDWSCRRPDGTPMYTRCDPGGVAARPQTGGSGPLQAHASRVVVSTGQEQDHRSTASLMPECALVPEQVRARGWP